MSTTPARDALDGLAEVLAHEEGLDPAESAAALAWVAENFDIMLACMAESGWKPTADQLRTMGGERWRGLLWVFEGVDGD
jgi:hypothetical protein